MRPFGGQDKPQCVLLSAIIVSCAGNSSHVNSDLERFHMADNPISHSFLSDVG